MTSPPGGGITARPKRASSGPASRNEARMRSDSGRSTSTQSGLRSPAQSVTSLSPVHATRTPMWSSSPSIASTSLMRGTLRTTISSSVSTLAARMGRAPFLLPAGTTVPDNGAPPWMRNFSMSGRVVPAAEVVAEGPSSVATVSGGSTVTAMSVRVSRDEAWSLLSEWVGSESLRRHCLCVEAAMRAYARKGGEDEELWGVTGLLHDADYERFPDMDDAESGHPRTIMAELERRDAPPEMVRAHRVARRLPRRVARQPDGAHAARGRRAVGLPRGLRGRAARRASTASRRSR